MKNMTTNLSVYASNRCQQRRSGQALIEMALIVTILLFLTMGIVQYGILYNASTSLTNITREGARYAAVVAWQSGKTDEDIRARMREVAANTSIRPTDLNITITPARDVRRSGEKVTVTVQYNMTRKLFLPASFPGLRQFSSTYTTSGTMLSEGP